MALRDILRGPTVVKDRGYVWWILFMSLISHSLHRGFSFGVVGNLTIAHQNYFGIGLQQSSTIGSVHIAVTFLFAPIASVLVKRFTCRMIQMIGGGCLILGLGLSSLSTESWHAIVLFGVLAGIGVSCTYMASSTILSKCFDKHSYLAFAAVILGSFVGSTLWPIGSQYLLDEYGYSKAMGFLAIFHIFHILAGISFLEPETPASVELNDQDLNMKVWTTQSSEELVDEKKNNKTGEEIERDSTAVASAVLKQNSDVHLLKHDILILVKCPQIWSLLVNSFLWNSTNTAFHILINDYIVNRIGLGEKEVALSITVLGVAKLVGSALAVALSPLKFDRLILRFVTVAVYGSATIAISFSNIKEVYYTFLAIWGVSFAMSLGNLLAVVLDFCGERLLPLLFGLELLAAGLGSLLGTSLYTYISESTEEQYGLIAAGSAAMLACIIILPLVIYKQRINKGR